MNIKRLTWLIAISAIIVPLFSGCSKEALEDTGATVVVHGATLDKKTSFPVMGIRVVLNAYRKSDSRTRKPVKSDTTYSLTNGLFEIITSERSANLAYELVATDVDGVKGGSYSESVIGISLSTDSPSFDANTNTYHMEGNFFFLERN